MTEDEGDECGWRRWIWM